MAEIREKSPTEIRTERKLKDLQRNTLVPGPAGEFYSFFRNQVKDLVAYHFDKPKKRTMKPRSESPRAESKPLLARKSQKSTVKRSVTPRGDKVPEEFEKVKTMIAKRRFLLEGTSQQLYSLSKSLETVKVTTNREQLVKKVSEIEETHSQVIKDIENYLSSTHDSLRLIDKLAQAAAYEKQTISSEKDKEMSENVLRERNKFEAQIGALKEHNHQLSTRNKKDNKQQNKVQKTIATLTEELRITSNSLYEKQSEIQILASSQKDKLSETEVLCREIDKLNRELSSQHEKYETQLKALTIEISDLHSALNSASTEINCIKHEERDRVSMSSDMKNKEIDRLKYELNLIEEEFRKTNTQNRQKEESRQLEFSTLRHEVQRLQEHSHHLMKNDPQELHRLKIALEENERILIAERDRFNLEIENREQYKVKQKNEWATIYNSLKHEIKNLKHRITEMTRENETLIAQVNRNQHNVLDGKVSAKSQNDTLKQKLRERDHETRALWDVIGELSNIYQAKGRIDINDLKTLIVIKNLEDKARSKIKL